MATRGGSRGDRLRVAVLLGGPSSEHEVSLDGGRNVVAVLDPHRYDVKPVLIARDGTWRVLARGRKPFDPRTVTGGKAFSGPLAALAHLAAWPADVVFPVLHGRFGEDGTVQACLAAAGLPFVGSGSLGSALAHDKVHTKEILAFHGIATPPFEVLEAGETARGVVDVAARLAARFGTPLVLKDPCGGSSLEVHLCDDEGEIAQALGELAGRGGRILVEGYVGGRELTAGVLEDRDAGTARALPIVEIRPRCARSFDYHEKYSTDGAEELCPAPLEADVEERARALGLAVHQILGLRGLSRTDLILDDEGTLQVLEVNTLPGMTERGLVPLAARQAGIDFPSLIERLVRTASAGR